MRALPEMKVQIVDQALLTWEVFDCPELPASWSRHVSTRDSKCELVYYSAYSSFPESGAWCSAAHGSHPLYEYHCQPDVHVAYTLPLAPKFQLSLDAEARIFSNKIS